MMWGYFNGTGTADSAQPWLSTTMTQHNHDSAVTRPFVQGMGMRPDWDGHETRLVWEWDQTGMGMRPDWDGHETRLGLAWDQTGMGMRLDWVWTRPLRGNASRSFPPLSLGGHSLVPRLLRPHTNEAKVDTYMIKSLLLVLPVFAYCIWPTSLGGRKNWRWSWR